MSAATCPPPSDLERLFLGGLPEAEADLLEHHVLQCAPCLKSLKALLHAKETLSGVRRPQSQGEGDDSSAGPVVDALIQKLESLRPAKSPLPKGTAMITFACSACQKKLSVKENLTGKKVKCPACGQLVSVPAPVPAPVAASEEMRTLPPVSSPDAPSVAPALAPAESPTQPPESKPDATMAVKHDSRHESSLTDFLAPPQADDELGRLGKYRILKILGHGGMGVVYKGEDLKLKRTVAIKAMLPTLAASASCGERFMREAEAMAAVEHDHVVRIYQIDEERGIPFMAMEFLKGEPLDERLKRDEQIPLDEILRIGREIAEGLAAAHKTGLIHRDIKPGNIWLEERDGKSRVKILDFGLARAASQEAGLTQQGAIIGTPAYMAPEQGRGAEVDPRCDLFSLGVVLYRLCTGNQPFHGPDTVSTLMAVAMHDPVVPIKVNQELLPELSDLVMKLLEKDPADRVATAGEVVKAIQAMERKQAVEKIAAEKTDAITAGPPRSHGTAGKRSSQDSAPAPTQTVALPRRRSMALLVVGVLGVFGVLALLGGGIFYWQTNNGTVRIEVNDPDIQVSFDKKDLIFKGVDKQDLRVSPGEYGLHVKRGDLEFDTDKPIVIKRGDAITLKIEWHKDGKLQVAEAGKVLGEKAVPAVVVANAPRFKNDLGMEFALVPKGKAWLGGSNGKEGPNEVNIPQDFYLDVYEVTQEEWQKVMGMDKNPSAFSRGGASRAWVNNIADDELKRFPVENVWWDQAKEFVKLVNEKVNKDAREAGWEYRLPTEQQWEYACRGGPMTDKAESAFDFYFDKPSKTLAKDQANFEGSGLKRTRQVGSYAPNRLGLYDMHGNVREWCENGTDPKKGWLRATRGGGWESDPGSCASAYRPDGTPHDAHWGGLGLRLARVPVAKTDETPIGPPAAVSIVHKFEGHPGAVTSRRRARGRRKCRRRRSCSCCPANT